MVATSVAIKGTSAVLRHWRSPRTVLVLVVAVKLDQLNDVTVTYSVSTVTLHVWEAQKICCKPAASTAITQDEQLVFSEREEVIWLGDEVTVPEEDFVVFANEGIDGEETDESRSGIGLKGICFFTYLTGPPRLRGGPGPRRVRRKRTAPSC